MKINDRQVHGFPLVADGRREVTDDAVPGLSIRIGKSAKVFRLVIGTGTNRKRFTVGTYDPPHFTLAMAREKARTIIAQERLRTDELPRTTFQEALDTYYRVHLSTLRPGSETLIRGALDRYFRPALGKRMLTDIKRIDIAPLIDALDTPYIRHNAFHFLATFLNWTVRRGYLETAPTDRMESTKRPPSRDRVLSPAELVAIWHAAPDDNFGRIIKLCLLTAQRRHQWAAARREYISGDTITWPGSLMKESKPHTLPLTPHMRSLIPDRIGYLFSHDGSRPFTSWIRAKRRLEEVSGVQDFRIHDFRRTWATVVAEELDIQPHVIESVLSHVSGTRVARIYNRARYLEQMRKALLAFEEWLQTQLSNLEDNHERRQLR